MASTIRTQLEAWLKTLDIEADKVLDVGGSNLPVNDRVGSWNVKKYEILDLMLENIKRKPDIVWDMNYPTWSSRRTAINQDNFDIVFCLETMEYIWNPVVALQNMNRLLKQGGILYISFSFIYPHHNPEGKDYLRFTRWGIEKLLKETGFKIEELIPRTEDLRKKDDEKEKQSIKVWYGHQRMHPCKTCSWKIHHEIGYICKAIKI